jgi:FkbM family methyltransferase
MKDTIKRIIKRSGRLVTSNLSHEHRVISADVNKLSQEIDRIANEVNAVHASVDGIKATIHAVLAKQNNTRIIHTGPHEIIARTVTGLKIYLDTRDLSVTPHLALEGTYEDRITKAWLSLISPESTVIDIGANFGYYGALAAQRTDKKKSKVIYFEANPHLIPYIRKTLAVNWINEQSVVENLGLAGKEGHATLHILKDYIGSSSLHTAGHIDSFMHGKMYTEVSEEVKIRTVTLDNYCKEHNVKNVDLIKMDIEGYEEDAYNGMRNTVKVSPNLTLFVEFTKQSYDKPKIFYEKMLSDFGNIYIINNQGELKEPTDKSYEAVVDYSDDWVMLVFSKRMKPTSN